MPCARFRAGRIPRGVDRRRRTPVPGAFDESGMTPKAGTGPDRGRALLFELEVG